MPKLDLTRDEIELIRDCLAYRARSHRADAITYRKQYNACRADTAARKAMDLEDLEADLEFRIEQNPFSD